VPGPDLERDRAGERPASRVSGDAGGVSRRTRRSTREAGITFTVPQSQASGASRGQWLDRLLAADVADVLANDRRTAQLDLAVAVHRRVAHVEGEVRDHDELELVRMLTRRVAGLLAVWDLVRVAGEPELRVVDAGCGETKQVPWAIGVDVVARPGVDVVADLDEGLPFDSGSIDRLFAVHVLEHVGDMLAVMREFHRVLRPTGLLHVLTPLWRHVNAVADPTHVRYLDVQTFKYVCQPRPGVPPWRPWMVTACDSTVHADLQPLGPGEPLPAAGELARWFD
jgi:SAM-dependent methyltransferase